MAKLDDQISTLQEKLQHLKLRQQRIDARKRAIATVLERKAETRRKILLGGVMLEKLQSGELDKQVALKWLRDALARPADRALFDLDTVPLPVVAGDASVDPG